VPPFATITIHESQWPESLAGQLRDDLHRRQINHKFLYESPRQVRQWLKLHEHYSPARREPEFDGTYATAFAAVLEQVGPEPVHLIGLGCGGGQKEAALLQRLDSRQRKLTFTAVDVSAGMAITSLRAAWKHLEQSHCFGMVCDLALAGDLETYFDLQTMPGARRIMTFFGMIPNFEPSVTQEVLQRLIRPGDLLLCSANLAPGPDYRSSVERVLPQYDNALTRDWLWTLLLDLGLDRDSGELKFCIEEAPPRSGLLRIEVTLRFSQTATAVVEGEKYEFEPGSRLRVFFSYRHTEATLKRLLSAAALNVNQSWISASGEEGVLQAERSKAL